MQMKRGSARAHACAPLHDAVRGHAPVQAPFISDPTMLMHACTLRVGLGHLTPLARQLAAVAGAGGAAGGWRPRLGECPARVPALAAAARAAGRAAGGAAARAPRAPGLARSGRGQHGRRGGRGRAAPVCVAPHLCAGPAGRPQGAAPVYSEPSGAPMGQRKVCLSLHAYILHPVSGAMCAPWGRSSVPRLYHACMGATLRSSCWHACVRVPQTLADPRSTRGPRRNT